MAEKNPWPSSCDQGYVEEVEKLTDACLAPQLLATVRLWQKIFYVELRGIDRVRFQQKERCLLRLHYLQAGWSDVEFVWNEGSLSIYLHT